MKIDLSVSIGLCLTNLENRNTIKQLNPRPPHYINTAVAKPPDIAVL